MKYTPEWQNSKLSKEIKEKLETYRKNRHFDAKKYIEEKARVLNQYMRVSKLKSCVVAVSGGIDSAIVLGIAKTAMDVKDSPIKDIVPVTLPVFDDKATSHQPETVVKADELCKHFGLEINTIDITPIFNTISEQVEKALSQKGEGWAKGQLVAYSRTPTLYYITSLMSERNMSGIILGTNNKDEGAYLGYFGKASDGMVDVQVISDIHKSEVYMVAKELGVPEIIMNAIPTGDMYDARNDESVFGAPYDFVEFYLAELEGKISTSDLKDSRDEYQKMKNNLENLHRYNQHKYIAASPAVHIDLKELEYKIEGGWRYQTWN